MIPPPLNMGCCILPLSSQFRHRFRTARPHVRIHLFPLTPNNKFWCVISILLYEDYFSTGFTYRNKFPIHLLRLGTPCLYMTHPNVFPSNILHSSSFDFGVTRWFVNWKSLKTLNFSLRFERSAEILPPPMVSRACLVVSLNNFSR